MERIEHKDPGKEPLLSLLVFIVLPAVHSCVSRDSGSTGDFDGSPAAPLVTAFDGDLAEPLPDGFIVGGRFGTGLTTIENAASCALPPCPSLTPMPMFANVPTLAAVGVPCSRPVVVLNVAQLGLFAMLNVSVPPSESLAVGWNE